MKNVIFFVVLAVLTVAALVGWRALKSQPSSNQVAEVTNIPTPTAIAGTALGRESGANVFDAAVPSPTISGETDVTKGGSSESNSVTPTVTAINTNSFVQPSSGSSVSYTNNGFNPKTLTVKSGTMIKFVNQSGNQMWIMSVETSGGKKLDGMDMGVSVGKDGSYEYQFNSPGSWGYTNKNNQSQTGVITVN
jgi:plastocyanin